MWLLIASLYTTGVATLAYTRGVDKGLDKIGTWQQETVDAITKAMQTEHNRQMVFIEEREPIIEERIVERDKWRTRIEEVVISQPSDVSCNLSDELLDAYNQAVRNVNTDVPK